MNYKLIAMDLDGTLNNDQKQITDITRAALMNAQRKGIRLALASARPSPGLYRERNELRLQDHRGILMSYNGGRIVDAATGEVLFETCMDLDETKSVLRELEKLPVTPILDDGKQFYVTDRNGYKVDYECWNNRMECTEVENLADFLNFAPIKILMSVDPAEIEEVQAKIAALLPESLIVVKTAAFYLEVIPKQINKGQGILDICKVLDIRPEEVISFGDAHASDRRHGCSHGQRLRRRKGCRRHGDPFQQRRRHRRSAGKTVVKNPPHLSLQIVLDCGEIFISSFAGTEDAGPFCTL